MTEKGMRLVAMIEEKENGQYEVVNFLPDLKIKHIQGKEFEVIEEKHHIQIPYAQGINDLTVIVGENGVGKTRLVNDIFSLDEKKMFVFKHKRNGYYALNRFSGNESTWGLIFKGVKLEGADGSERFFENTSVIKFSNAMEFSFPQSSWRSIDLSTTALLNKNNHGRVVQLDADKQIKFLFSNSCKVERLEKFFTLSDKSLKISFNENLISHYLESIQMGFDVDYFKGLEEFTNTRFETNEEKFSFYLMDYFAYLYSLSVYRENPDNELDYLGLFQSLDNIFIKNWQGVKGFLIRKIEEAKNLELPVNLYIKNELERSDNYEVKQAVYKYHFNNYETRQKFEELKRIKYFSESFFIELDGIFNFSGEQQNAVIDMQSGGIGRPLAIGIKKRDWRYTYVLDCTEKIYNLIDIQLRRKVFKYEEWHDSDYVSFEYFMFIIYLIDSLTFQWQGLSSGQLAFLNLFGRLHSLSEEVKDKESILLLLDEIDLGLHPEWQRKWVSTALPIIGEIFKGKHVQIILTTHSPIMLSDIYGENVLMLRKDPETGERQVVYGDEVPSTSFGQNIHQLFKESFFLEQTKGDYSLKIINATIKAVYDLNQEGADEAAIKADFASELGVGDLSDGQFRAYLEKVIGAIGEKVIAQKLQDMYQTIPLWSQASSLEGKRAGDLSTEELRQLLRQREEAGQ